MERAGACALVYNELRTRLGAIHNKQLVRDKSGGSGGGARKGAARK